MNVLINKNSRKLNLSVHYHKLKSLVIDIKTRVKISLPTKTTLKAYRYLVRSFIQKKLNNADSDFMKKKHLF